MARELLMSIDRVGVRLTGPRRKAAALIAAQQGHFTAADLIDAARRKRLTLGRATIFRLLDALTEQGVVERVDLPNGQHAYVACETAHHHHIVCVVCGATEKVADCGIKRVTAEAARRTGFEVESHRLELFGRCPACRTVKNRATKKHAS